MQQNEESFLLGANNDKINYDEDNCGDDNDLNNNINNKENNKNNNNKINKNNDNNKTSPPLCNTFFTYQRDLVNHLSTHHLHSGNMADGVGEWGMCG